MQSPAQEPFSDPHPVPESLRSANGRLMSAPDDSHTHSGQSKKPPATSKLDDVMKQVYLAAYGTPTPPNVQPQPTTPAHVTPKSPNVQGQAQPRTSAYGTPTKPSVQSPPTMPAYPLKELQKSICISIINLIEIINTNHERLYANDNNVLLVQSLYMVAGQEHCEQTSRRGHFADVSNTFKIIFGNMLQNTIKPPVIQI